MVLRIAHIVSSISDKTGGPSYSVVRLCEFLRAHGHEVTLAALDHSEAQSSFLSLKTFPLGKGPHKLGRSPELKKWLSSRAGSKAFDILHNNGFWRMANVYPGQIARKYAIPYVVSPMGTLGKWPFGSGSKIKRLFWPLVQRPSLAAVTCFRATSNLEYEDIRRMGFRQPVAVVPHGIDVPVYRTKSHGPMRTLLFLSRLHPKKGLEFLLRAWNAVQHSFVDWRLRIVGPDESDHRKEMQRLARVLRLERVAFVAARYGEEKWQEFQEADLFVLPSRHENFGVVVAEALAAGTPAIVTKGTPWAELETRGAGWWIDIGVDPLVACLEKALAFSPETLAGMGRAGRDWMINDFSWERTGSMMVETYQWIVDGGECPPWVIKN